MALARISLTIPGALLRDLDKRTKAVDRSRSRVIVDAIRKYLAESGGTVGQRDAGTRALRVAEETAPPYGAALVAEARASQLKADLALPQAERLRRAEELLRLAPGRSRSKRHQVLAFDTYDDYYEWKKTRNLGI